MSPRGRPLTQSRVAELAAGPGPADRLRPVRGRRPAGDRGPRARGGLDRRLCAVRRRNRRDGADRRLRPAVAGGDGQSRPPATDESFSEGLLEYPQYTRPQEFEGRPIPEILISGDHAKVAAWRRAEAEALTRARRPDLWAAKARPKTPQKARQTGDKRAPLPYTSAKSAQWQDRWTFAQPALDWLGAPPMEISMNLIQQLEKEQFDKLSADQDDSGIRARRHRDRQRQGGRRRPHPRAGL